MAIPVVCRCGRSFNAKDEQAGLRGKCPACGNVIEIPAPDPGLTALLDDSPEEAEAIPDHSLAESMDEIKVLLGTIARLLQDQGVASAQPSGGGKRRYKVLTRKDPWFAGKFDPEMLEQALNAYAVQGWSVRGLTTANIPESGDAREELIVLMER